MTTSQRAQLILNQVKNLAAMPEHERKTGSDGIRHLLWVSLESGDEATLQSIRNDMTRHEHKIYRDLLNEAAFEPVVQNGDRKVYSQLIAFPVIIERIGPGFDFPVEIKNERPIIEAIAKAQVGGTNRGISLQKHLFSFSELMTIPHTQMYRNTVESVKTAWAPGKVTPMDCRDSDIDPYTADMNEAGHILALRFFLVTSFTYAKTNFSIPDWKLEDMADLLSFVIEENTLAKTSVKFCQPGRIDHAILGAIPEYYGQATRALLAMDGNTKTMLQMEMDGSNGVLAAMPEDNSSQTGIAIFLPPQEEDVTQSVVASISRVTKAVTGNDMTLTIGGQAGGALH